MNRLLLPLCTTAAWRDARIAGVWIALLPAMVRRRQDVGRGIAKLVERY